MGERVKTAVVTGASSGFGLLTAVELAKRGFSVIATMRNLDNRDTIIRLCKQHQVEKQLTMSPIRCYGRGVYRKFQSQFSRLFLPLIF